jgi:hypothetical protein
MALVTATPSPALLAAVPAAVSEALAAAAAAAAPAAAPAVVTVAALLQHLAALRTEAHQRCEYTDVSGRPLSRTADALQAALCEHLPDYAAANAVVVPAATASAAASGNGSATAQLALVEGAATGTLFVLMPDGAAAGKREHCVHALTVCYNMSQ